MCRSLEICKYLVINLLSQKLGLLSDIFVSDVFFARVEVKLYNPEKIYTEIFYIKRNIMQPKPASFAFLFGLL